MQTLAKPAYTKGIMWFLFSGTAMASAFLLPVHLWALFSDHTMQSTSLSRLYFFFLAFCVLYHGLYRTQTILADLGLGRYAKISGGILIGLFIFGISLAGYLFFWSL